LASLLDSARLLIQQRTHRISTLPIVVVYLNDICDSRCVSCSIWKNNDALKAPAERQMQDSLLEDVVTKVQEWRAREVLLSGGEPALHPRFLESIGRFKQAAGRVSVVTNGLLLNSLEPAKLGTVSAFYISFDAPDRESYKAIRGIDGFDRLRKSLAVLRSLAPRPAIVARCTLQRANVRLIPQLVHSAREAGFDRISFLAVDVSSRAFARDRHGPTDPAALEPTGEDLRALEDGIRQLRERGDDFVEGGTGKLERILGYFRALSGEVEFPEVRCNAPWVSVVVETTGAIRGCFFQPVVGNLDGINGTNAMHFRQALDVRTDSTCRRCVCSKELGPREFLRM
jgi:MoaA/NifB/PqqE/SkfB family radical SAM enzyme